MTKSSPVKNKVGPIVFFRDDDVGELDANIKRIIELFQKHEISLSLEVVPKNLQKEFVNYFNSLENKELFDIGQHGYAHIPYKKNDKNLGEFGSNRKYDDKKKDIENGWKIIERNFPEQSAKIFVPPWGLMDEETYKILGELNFEAFSLTGKKRIERIAKKIVGFFYRPRIVKKCGMIDLLISMNNMSDFSKKIPSSYDKLIKDFKRCSGENEYVGILLHDKIMNDKTFEALEQFIIYLKKNNLQIMNMRQIIEEKIWP